MDDEFLCARQLFLLTYDTDTDFTKLVETYYLANALNSRLFDHATTSPSEHPLASSIPASLALTETLKLLFNLLHYASATHSHFAASTPAVLALLLAAPRTPSAVAGAIKDPGDPLPHLIAALLNLPLERAIVFNDERGTQVVECLVELADVLLRQDDSDVSANGNGKARVVRGMETSMLASLLSLTTRVCTLTRSDEHVPTATNQGDEALKCSDACSTATTSKSPVPHTPQPPPSQSAQNSRLYLQSHLLPSSHDRAQPLGVSHSASAPDPPSLPNRLLHLVGPSTTTSAAPHAPTTAAAAAALLLVLSDGDPTTLVRNIGLGHASGILASAGLAPHSASANLELDDADFLVDGKPVDPTTGQFVSARDAALAGNGFEAPFAGPAAAEMSEDEKLREAERLYVLFERLRASGVVQVENPVHAAARAGRFVEVAEEEGDDGGA